MSTREERKERRNVRVKKVVAKVRSVIQDPEKRKKIINVAKTIANVVMIVVARKSRK